VPAAINTGGRLTQSIFPFALLRGAPVEFRVKDSAPCTTNGPSEPEGTLWPHLEGDPPANDEHDISWPA
jgi:hypothetical protein